MRIILAPAKNMQLVEDSPYELSKPQFLAKTQILLDKLKRLSFDELKKVYKASDEIVLQNMERLKITDLEKNLSPACLSYNGIAFKHLSANVFSFFFISFLLTFMISEYKYTDKKHKAGTPVPRP